MLKRRFFLTIAALTVLLSAVNCSYAQLGQEGLSMGPSARPMNSPGTVPDYDFFDYDAQLWAPWDVTSLNGHQHPKTGFYFSFDYAYLSLSNPGVFSGTTPVDVGGGSKMHWARDTRFGFMGNENKGFGVNWLRLNEGTTFLLGGDGTINQPLLLNTSVNVVEMNRTFRQMLSTGGYLEPFFGLRYAGVTDDTIEDNAANQRFKQNVTNSGFGAQVGARYFREYGRWKVQTNAAISGSYNSQRYNSEDIAFNTATATGTTTGFVSNESSSFVPGLDLGVRFSWHFTRDVSMRVGGQLAWMWSGVARVDPRTAALNPYSNQSLFAIPTAITTDQDMLAAGVSFGIDWNR